MNDRIEAAATLGRDLAGVIPSYCEFLSALAHALPAVEIVDSAIEGWKLTIVDTVADNASSGLYVLGSQPSDVGRLQFGDVGARLDKNHAVASVGTGAACLGHPLRAAYWLARTLLRRGETLRAGEVILSGALGPMIPVAAGDFIAARAGELGSVSFRMV
jgi:2-keto-4-pentenoate hydratase